MSPVLSNRAGLKSLLRQVVLLPPLPQNGNVDHQTHWNSAYETKGDEVSWFEGEPTQSLRLIEQFAPAKHSLLDVGSGASWLLVRLAERGWSDLNALDVSSTALALLAERLGGHADVVTMVLADIRTFVAHRSYVTWHDRAVLHFLNRDDDRIAYAETVAASLQPGGVAIIGGFSPDGPTHCSGLEVRQSTSKEIASLFGERFTLLNAEIDTHITPQGNAQSFSWTVLRREETPRTSHC